MVCLVIFFFFFFSSRRRHTRYIGDWSSDVCSSDLPPHDVPHPVRRDFPLELLTVPSVKALRFSPSGVRFRTRQSQIWKKQASRARSEERRVGKECRSQWSR